MERILFVFTVFIALTEGQVKPEVTIWPGTKEIYSGDTLVLSCNGSGQVTWFLNDQKNDHPNETWIISAVSTRNSGSYSCQRDSLRSDPKNITVLEYIPPATLSLISDLPVITQGDSVVLELQVDEGLEGWFCRVYKGHRARRIIIRSTLMSSNETRVQIHPKTLLENESPALYWCEHKTTKKRSNLITITTTDKMVMLETLPEPATLGKELTLQCLVWGQPIISEAAFFKDGKQLSISSFAYKIAQVKQDDEGSYHCKATYKFKDNKSNLPHTVASDPQVLKTKAALPQPVLTNKGNDMSCTCEKCAPNHTYRYYYKGEDGKLMWVKDRTVLRDGKYMCRAVWAKGVSMLSQPIHITPGISWIILILVILGILLFVALIIYCIKRKRAIDAAKAQDAAYEELPQGKDAIEMQKAKAGEQGGEGGYEALKRSKTDEKEGVYHTLGAGEGKGGEGGYEALKRSKTDEKEGEYQTLGAEGGKGGEGGYEALKRSKTDEKEGEYQTLGAEGGKGGEGGYEALKISKTDEKEGEYQTLGAGGGKGGE
ncbi:uncharacterized protein LOC118782200 [Megalops cyprinoides]|uniref:uncharacterized protein LOC118782200 n=1 Tax=Megalops cyprinoides TaxID=118141 RepID=UPI001864592C|nr:uncharacterized protein LOC118782200 [Megalops cyprinoides]